MFLKGITLTNKYSIHRQRLIAVNMAPNTQSVYLRVYVHLGDIKEQEPNQICITFPTQQQATSYHTLIVNETFVTENQLGPYVSDHTVWMRLPSKIANIVACTRCHGFYLHFLSPDYANEWRKALYLWRKYNGKKNMLYIERDTVKLRLNDHLGIRTPKAASNVWGRANSYARAFMVGSKKNKGRRIHKR